MQSYTIEHNPLQYKFFTIIDDLEAYVLYSIDDEKLTIHSTYVPKLLEGKGIASKLTKECYEYAKSKKLKPAATCSYAVVWLKRHKLGAMAT